MNTWILGLLDWAVGSSFASVGLFCRLWHGSASWGFQAAAEEASMKGLAQWLGHRVLGKDVSGPDWAVPLTSPAWDPHREAGVRLLGSRAGYFPVSGSSD